MRGLIPDKHSLVKRSPLGEWKGRAMGWVGLARLAAERPFAAVCGE
jgi:hypothetical protein